MTDRPTEQVRQLPLDAYLFLTLALSIFALGPLFYPGYFQTHSAFLPIWDVADLRQNLTDWDWRPGNGQFQVFYSGGLLPYYVAALLPATPLVAVKAVLALSLLAGVSGLYLWLKSWLGGPGSCVAALVYLYAPFTLATIYVRGAFSEVAFWGFLPWALLAATYLVVAPRLPIFLIAGSFWAALGTSHLGLSIFAWLFLAGMQFGFHRAEAPRVLGTAALGLLPPLLFNLTRITTWADVNPAAHYLYPGQLVSAFWGYGPSQPGWEDGLSLSLGLAPLGLAILSGMIWRGGPDRRPWYFLGTALTITLLLLPPFQWLWQIPGLKHLLQFNWQLLGLAALGLAVFSGVGFWLAPSLRTLPLLGAVLLFVLLPVYPHLEPRFVPPPLPTAAEGRYAEGQILLLDHRFVIANPQQPEDDLTPVETYLPLLPETLQPGDTFFLQVTWQATALLPQDYKIFAHLVDGNGERLAQVDILPQNGERPTSSWIPGELIADQYTFTLPDARQPVAIWLGFYDEETFQRLETPGDAEGRVILELP